MPDNALALIPGAGCTASLWKHQIETLSDSATIHLVENRQHPTAEALVAAALEQLPPRFALAGLSQGGILALEFMRQAPRRVERLALLDTMAGPEPPSAAARHRAAIVLATLGLHGLIERIMWPKLVAKDRLQDESLRGVVHDMLHDTGTRGVINQQKIFLTRRDYRPYLEHIHVPTLIMVGDKDLFTPLAAAQDMARHIPNAQLVIIPESGHLSSLEAPELVTEHLHKWLVGTRTSGP